MLYPMETNMSIQRFVTTPLQVNLFVLVFHLIFCALLQADEVDTAFVKNYTVVYKAVDAAGNIGSATRTVVIGKSSISISLRLQLQTISVVCYTHICDNAFAQC